MSCLSGLSPGKARLNTVAVILCSPFLLLADYVCADDDDIMLGPVSVGGAGELR